MSVKTIVKYNTTLVWSLGIAIAVTISWSIHKSVLWATIHGILNWIFVFYYFITNYLSPTSL